METKVRGHIIPEDQHVGVKAAHSQEIRRPLAPHLQAHHLYQYPSLRGVYGYR